MTAEKPGTRVVVVGSANLDIVVRQQRLARPGETVRGHQISMESGGKGLNQAVALARAGAPVTFLGRIGRDVFGYMLRRTLVAEGIDVTNLVADRNRFTGSAIVSVLDDGENSIVVVAGANESDEWTSRENAAVQGVGAVVAQLERPIPLIRTAFAAARRIGVPTFLTPAPVSPDVRELLDLTDVLLLNEGEAREIAGEPETTQAARALSREVGLVVLTRGAQSTLITRNGAVVHEEPARTVPTLDTTSAGDCFAGYFIRGLVAGHDISRSARDATTAASLCVQRPGSSSSIPSLNEVREADSGGRGGAEQLLSSDR
ncbi:ribokinase [Kribbella yunnanensis]|uniref:Ribokinase n=2 Tax=Kribbella yunnanensis TaxID=190194 RepID=A0ABP4UVV0_9ACTN